MPNEINQQEIEEVRYRLNPVETIPSIVRDCLDGYASVDQAVEAIRRILTEARRTNEPAGQD